MRLPLPLIESRYFIFPSIDELKNSLGDFIAPSEIDEISRLDDLGLPPITSVEVLGLMFGLNPGIIWSFQHRTQRHYRSFDIKKGKGVRKIDAPKVGLKIIQKWISHHLEKVYAAPDHVYGFIPGRSHIDAANVHCGSFWVYSNDILNFFPATPKVTVQSALMGLGYQEASANLIASLCCLRGFLAQGAPSSPIISNIVFSGVDKGLVDLKSKYGLRLSRYADDIVYSGLGDFPEELHMELVGTFAGTPWQLSPEKRRLSCLPARLKVHGLLVHGEVARLTKGYRNRIRAFSHVMDKIGPDHRDYHRLKGHINYGKQVKSKSRSDKNSAM